MPDIRITRDQYFARIEGMSEKGKEWIDLHIQSDTPGKATISVEYLEDMKEMLKGETDIDVE